MSADAPTRTRRRGTVRFRITAVATIAVVLVLSVAGVALVLLQRRVLTDSLDETLAAEAGAIVDDIHRNGIPTKVVIRGDDDAVAQLVDGDFQVVARSGPRAPSAPIVRTIGGEVDHTTVDDVQGLDGHQRVIARHVRAPSGEPFTIVIASPIDDIDDSVEVLGRSLLVMVPIVAAVLAALVWWLVGRTLRPVEAIRDEVATIRGGRLDRRVPEPAGDDEIARLAHTMNAMLDRLEEADAQQRQFVGDASHELRTPLTRMRAALEVDRAHPQTADLDATQADLLEEVIGLQGLVEDLLLLSRTSGDPHVVRAPVDLSALVRREVERATPDGSLDAVSVSTTGTVEAEGDASGLARVVRNLVDNACRHATSQVSVDVRASDGHALLVVSDDGPGIPPERREEVFDRFTRLDEARSGGAGGTGLGLSIVSEIVARHGGTVSVDERPGGGARFTVTLPRSTEPSPIVDDRD